jgi:hypothetical protein
MKVFYTERDIVDMHAAGLTRLEIDDNVVLTDLAREKAQDLGIALVPAGQPDPYPSAAPANPSSPPSPHSSQAELVARIKAGVIAKLGTDAYNDLLDQIIPRVLAQLNTQPPSTQTPPPSPKSSY